MSLNDGVQPAVDGIRGTPARPDEDSDYEQVGGVTRKKNKKNKQAETKLKTDSANNLFTTDGKWGTKETCPEQEALYPDTVRMADVVTEVFDLSDDGDRTRYSAFFAQILARDRIMLKELQQPPDAGKMNFRLLVIHGQREYMNITPR